MTWAETVQSFLPAAWHTGGVLELAQSRPAPVSKRTRGALVAVVVAAAASVPLNTAEASAPQIKSSVGRPTFVGHIGPALETKVSRERQLLAYLEEALEKGFIGTEAKSTATNIWLRARDKGVIAPVAAVGDDGSVCLMWSGKKTVTTADVLPDGPVEWFHRDTHGKTWSVDLPLATPINKDVLKRLA